jgi:hypothetical protein
VRTIHNVKNGLQRIYVDILGKYFLYLTILFWLGSEDGKKSRSSFTNLVVSHGVVVVFVILLFHHWKRHLPLTSSFRVPDIDIHARKGETLTPATLPLRSDVLITPHYASEVLGEYSRVLDVAHPGNRQWMLLTRTNAMGYHKLPPALQEMLAWSLSQWVRDEGARFLSHDSRRRWVEVEDPTELKKLCHKQLLMASHPLIEAMLRQLDSLKAEIVWGRWQGKAIYKTVSSAYLDTWESELLQPLKTRLTSKPASSAIVFIRSRLASFRSHTVRRTPPRSATPPVPQPEPPYAGAWIKEGDIVDAMFKCEDNGE